MPTSKKKEPADLEEYGKDSNSGTVTASSASAESTAAWKTRKVYYQVAWWDRFDVQVNRVRSYIAWTYNGSSCILNPSSRYTGTWWAYWSGWARLSVSWRKATFCINHFHYSDATFVNPVFCRAAPFGPTMTT